MIQKCIVKKICWLLAALFLLIIIPTISAAPASQLVSEFTLVDDRSAAPVSYTFFTEPASSTLKFHELYSQAGTDAQLIVYVESTTGPTEVQLKFSREFVTAYSQNGNIILQVDRRSLNCCSPYAFAIQEGKLTVTIGDKSRTVDNILAFKGSFTSQSLTGKAAVYK